MHQHTSTIKKIKLKTQLAMIFILLSSPFLSKAEVYKWVDKNGNTHYSDIQPNETKSEKLNIKSSTPSKERTTPQDAAKNLDQKKSKELEAQAERLKSETEKRELNAQCENTKDNLKTIQENSRIKINDNGQVRYLTPEEIAKKKQEYTDLINTQCTK